MIQKRKNRFFAAFLCAMALMCIFPVNANADMGPKASVRILFQNMGDEVCYGTLLSKEKSLGPQTAWDGREENIQTGDLDLNIWKAFAGYRDPDGYFFLQIGWPVSETKEIPWTYYPPQSFKILLYYPETGRYLVSGICERYAFDTYYTVDMGGIASETDAHDDALSGSVQLETFRSYDYQTELLSLLARVLLTIAVEMVAALLFGFRKKKQLLLLAGVNTATQILLNVLLNVFNYLYGEWAFVFFYVLFELLVIAIEAVVYCIFMNHLTDQPKKKSFYILYALVANAVSFAVGLLLARVLPGIF